MSGKSEFAPVAGQPLTLEPGLRLVLAPNPSPMTYLGTNTYLVGEGEVALIDPGPDHEGHMQAILAALAPGERISHIFVTHSHLDHSPLARPLSRATGAPVLAFGPSDAGRSPVMARLAKAGAVGGGEGVDHGFAPDILLADLDEVAGPTWRLRAHWTPGHFGNHLCFQWDDRVFTGDQVMGWASSLISPPDGDLGAYMASLERLDGLQARRLYSGHGAPIDDPARRLAWLAAHRRSREAEIIAALSKGPATAEALTDAIYADVSTGLKFAAARNVFAHLIDLTQRNIAVPKGELGFSSVFRLNQGSSNDA